MDKIFQRLLDNHFSELPGLIVDAFIPVPEDLINEVIQTTLVGNRNISYLHVSIGRDNQVAADVKSPLLPWTIHVKLKLFGSVDLTGSPKVRAFLENNLLLGKLGAFLNALPDGVRIHGDQVAVDLGLFLLPEQKELLDLVQSIDIRTTEGMVALDVKIAS